jgi:hypothetical protein
LQPVALISGPLISVLITSAQLSDLISTALFLGQYFCSGLFQFCVIGPTEIRKELGDDVSAEFFSLTKRFESG